MIFPYSKIPVADKDKENTEAEQPKPGYLSSVHELLLWASLKLSLLSVLSVFSILSVGSTLSVASSFSLLSIASHQSILSIGCNNRFLAICNHKSYSDVELAVDGGDLSIDRVVKKSGPCSNVENTTATVYYSSSHDLKFEKYEICSVDEETPYTCSADKATHFDADKNHVCLDEDDVGKDKTLFARKRANVEVQSVAHMPRNYDYNRKKNYKDNYVEIKNATIVIPDATDWSQFSTCTKKEKINDEDICDYKAASCTFDGKTYECKVKRKGNGSWRDVDKKPSLKVKWKDSGNQYRLTFNNNVQEKKDGAQIDAYETYRKAGIEASRASRVQVRFGPSLDSVNEYLPYTQVEEVKNFEFLGARGLDGSTVFELELLSSSFLKQDDIDRGPDTYDLGPVAKDDATLLDFQRVLKHGASLQETWEVINKTNMFRYYAGVKATSPLDSFCGVHWKGSFESVFEKERGYNNAFVVLPYFHKRYTFMPWGTDRAMQCKAIAWFMPSSYATCNPMKRCFENAQCSKEYHDFVDSENLPPKLCGSEHMYIIITSLITGVILLSRFACCMHCTCPPLTDSETQPRGSTFLDYLMQNNN